MANNIIKRVWNQNRMVNIEDLCGMAFQAESGGHTFEISGVDDTGATVNLSGTVTGVFRRPDNADIALTGAASDGVASVTLTDDCYAVPGRFGLTIYTTADGQKTAVYAAVGTVAATNGGAVAGDTPQDVVDLINAIEAAVATIPASYSGLMADIAPTYSSLAVYPVGAYVYYNGDLYRCTTSITTGESWTAAHWTAAVLGKDVSELKSHLSVLSLATDAELIYGNFVSGQYINNTISANTSRACFVVGNVSKSAKVYFDETKYALTYFYVNSTSDLTLVKALGSWNTSGVMELDYREKGAVVLQIKDTINDAASLVSRLDDINKTTILSNIKLFNGSVSGTSLAQNAKVGIYCVGYYGSYPVSNFSDMPVSDFNGGALINIPVGSDGNSIIQYLVEVNSNAKNGRRFLRNADGNWETKHQYNWLAYGDSITYGSYSTQDGGTEAGATRGYAYRIANYIKRDLISSFTNCAVRGIGWINTGNNGETLDDMLSSFVGIKADINLITIALGINDYLSNETLGTTEATEKDGTISGNIRYCLRWVSENFPNAKIIVISPMNSTMYGNVNTAWSRNVQLNNAGSLNDVNNMIKYWCDYFGVRFVNELTEGFINTYNAENYLKDHIHPTNDGQWMLAMDIAEKIF